MATYNIDGTTYSGEDIAGKIAEGVKSGKITEDIGYKAADYAEQFKVTTPTPNNQTIQAVTETPPTPTFEQGAVNTQQASQDIIDNAKVREEEIKVEQKKQEDLAKNQAAKQEEIIKQQEEEQKKIDAEKQSLIDKAKADELDFLEKQKNISLSQLNSDRELQRQKDEAAIQEAQKKQEISQMQANFAFGKMGLTFSSQAIGQTQALANQGASDIAGIKVQANYNQAKIAVKAAELELAYTKDINNTINTYTEKSLNLKSDTSKRLNEVQKSLLLTENEKNTSLSKIIESYRKEKYDIQDKMYAEMKLKAEKAKEDALKLQTQLKEEQNLSRDRMNTLITSGSWAGLTTQERDVLLKKSGLTLDEVNRNTNNYISTEGYKIFNKALGNNYIPSSKESEQLLVEVQRLLSVGKGMDEAINQVTSQLIQNNPYYKALRKAEENKLKPKVATTGKATSPKATTTPASALNSKVRLYEGRPVEGIINEITGKWSPVTDDKGGLVDAVDYMIDEKGNVVKKGSFNVNPPKSTSSELEENLYKITEIVKNKKNSK